MASLARSLRPIAFRAVKAGGYGARPAVRTFSMRSALHAKRYTPEHEWIEISADGKTGVIGISEYAAHALGDVVYVELPSADLTVEAGDTIGAVESVKSASDINSPVTCKVIEVNELLDEKPATINRAPEDTSAAGGWIAKVEVGEEAAAEAEKLMDEKAYKEFSASAEH